MSGQALVEFAIVSVALILIIFGIVEFGFASYAYSSIYNAAQEGARYGSSHPTDTAGIQTRVISTTVGLGLTAGNVSVSCAPCTSGNQITVTVTYTFHTATLYVIPNLPLTARGRTYIE